MPTKMVIRSTLDAPDFFIDVNDSLQDSVATLLNRITDPSSTYFISSEYLVYRLLECTTRINSREGPISQRKSILSSLIRLFLYTCRKYLDLENLTDCEIATAVSFLYRKSTQILYRERERRNWENCNNSFLPAPKECSNSLKIKKRKKSPSPFY